MGMTTLADISEYIMDTLKNHYNKNARIFMLSFNQYLVIYQSSTSGESHQTEAIDLKHQGIAINHKSINITINKDSSIYSILAELNKNV